MIKYLCKVVNLIIYNLTTSKEQKYRDIAIRKQIAYNKYIQEQSYAFLQNKR